MFSDISYTYVTLFSGDGDLNQPYDIMHQTQDSDVGFEAVCDITSEFCNGRPAANSLFFTPFPLVLLSGLYTSTSGTRPFIGTVVCWKEKEYKEEDCKCFVLELDSVQHFRPFPVMCHICQATCYRLVSPWQIITLQIVPLFFHRG